jgi:hypothetical protein
MSSLVKRIDIPQDALAVIGNMTWQVVGSQVAGRINDGQLARALYDAVNKGLDALGGKWHKKLRVHLFDDDPRPGIDQMLGRGFVEVERDGFFPTPPAVVEAMLSLLTLPVSSPWLEPEAGEGHICRVAGDRAWIPDGSIHVCEKNDKRRDKLADAGYCVVGSDFLQFTPKTRYNTILMNPPFELQQDIDHTTHAWEQCLADGGEMVAVCASGVRFNSNKKGEAFRKLVGEFGYFFDLPEDSFKDSGTRVNTCLVYLRKPLVVRHISPLLPHVQLGFWS